MLLAPFALHILERLNFRTDIEYTSSRPISEVKQCWARSVHGWEHWVLLILFLCGRRCGSLLRTRHTALSARQGRLALQEWLALLLFQMNASVLDRQKCKYSMQSSCKDENCNRTKKRATAVDGGRATARRSDWTSETTHSTAVRLTRSDKSDS